MGGMYKWWVAFIEEMGNIRAIDLAEPAFVFGVIPDLFFGTGRGGNASTAPLESIFRHGLDYVVICAMVLR